MEAEQKYYRDLALKLHFYRNHTLKSANHILSYNQPRPTSHSILHTSMRIIAQKSQISQTQQIRNDLLLSPNRDTHA